VANQITAAQLDQRISYETYRQTLNENLLEAAQTWVTLREATRLNTLTQERLEVVRPLFGQVETVANSGVVDRSIVSAARRLVNDIRAAEVDTQDQLRQARTAFRRTFGKLPGSSAYNSEFVATRTKAKVGESHILIAPQVVSQFLRYQQSLANLESAKAQDSTRFALEANINEPLGDTTEEGSRTAGLVISRTFYDGKRTQARINQASVRVVEARDTLQAAYREQGRAVFGFKESLDSVYSTIALARDAHAIAQEEVDTFRRQLAIGQSSLESVLQAEVRLYQAESELIRLDAAKTNLQLNLLAALGRLPEAFGIREADALSQVLAADIAK
jgi:outer membrane protein TolC